MGLREDRTVDDGEGGFTLVELITVVLILGILIAVAMFSYLGARERAQDRAAQQSLRNALAGARAAFGDADTYLGVDETLMPSLEPSLDYVAATAPSTAPNNISVDPVSQYVWIAAARSDSRTCFAIRDAPTGTTYAIVSGSCKAENAAASATFTEGGWT